MDTAGIALFFLFHFAASQYPRWTKWTLTNICMRSLLSASLWGGEKWFHFHRAAHKGACDPAGWRLAIRGGYLGNSHTARVNRSEFDPTWLDECRLFQERLAAQVPVSHRVRSDQHRRSPGHRLAGQTHDQSRLDWISEQTCSFFVAGRFSLGRVTRVKTQTCEVLDKQNKDTSDKEKKIKQWCLQTCFCQNAVGFPKKQRTFYHPDHRTHGLPEEADGDPDVGWSQDCRHRHDYPGSSWGDGGNRRKHRYIRVYSWFFLNCVKLHGAAIQAIWIRKQTPCHWLLAQSSQRWRSVFPKTCQPNLGNSGCCVTGITASHPPSQQQLKLHKYFLVFYRSQISTIAPMYKDDVLSVLNFSHCSMLFSGAWLLMDSPGKQGHITPISGYKKSIAKSVSLQSGIAQIEREQAMEAIQRINAQMARSSQIHKTHSEEDITNLKDSRVESASHETDKAHHGTSQGNKGTEQHKEETTPQETSDKIKRPQSLPLNTWEDDMETEGSKTVEEERGVASGASSPKVLEEISETVGKIQMSVNKPAVTSEARERVSHGEWYGSTSGSTSGQTAASSSSSSSRRDPHHHHSAAQRSSSQESIEAWLVCLVSFRTNSTYISEVSSENSALLLLLAIVRPRAWHLFQVPPQCTSPRIFLAGRIYS